MIKNHGMHCNSLRPQIQISLSLSLAFLSSLPSWSSWRRAHEQTGREFQHSGVANSAALAFFPTWLKSFTHFVLAWAGGGLKPGTHNSFLFKFCSLKFCFAGCYRLVIPHSRCHTSQAWNGNWSGNWDCSLQLFAVPELHPRAHLLFMKTNYTALVHTVMVMTSSFVYICSCISGLDCTWLPTAVLLAWTPQKL